MKYLLLSLVCLSFIGCATAPVLDQCIQISGIVVKDTTCPSGLKVLSTPPQCITQADADTIRKVCPQYQ